MITESLLKNTLIGLVEMCRNQSILLAKMSSEVAAPLEVARVDPAFDDLLAQKKAKAQQFAADSGHNEKEAIARCNETIQELRGFLVQ
jgi:hypothetical protein